MVTEISPIFGLSLLSMIEWVAIAISSSVAITGFLSWWNTHQSNNRMNEQLESQNKIASANLIIKYLKHWEGLGLFGKMILKLENTDAKFTDKGDMDFMLATFEDIAVFWKDETLTETHIREFFGRDIVRIGANKSIMKHVNEYYQQDIAHNYNNLVKLIKKSESWKMSP